MDHMTTLRRGALTYDPRCSRKVKTPARQTLGFLKTADPLWYPRKQGKLLEAALRRHIVETDTQFKENTKWDKDQSYQ